MNSDGDLIDGGLWVYAREFGNSFDHNFIDLSNAGRNPISINTSIDINNDNGEVILNLGEGTGSNYTINNFIYDTTSKAIGKIRKIVSDDIYLNSVRDGIFSNNEIVEEYSNRELTNLTVSNGDRISSVTTIMSNFDNISITFGSVTKNLNNGAGLKPYEVIVDCSGETLLNVYQYLKYVVRYDSTGSFYTINGDDGQEYRNASGSTWSDVKIAPFGTFAGGVFFGARGVWIENMAGADVSNYILIDSNGDQQQPPTQYSLELTGLVNNSEVRVYSGTTEPKTSEIAGVENSTDTFTYTYTYENDINVDIVIHNLGYVYIRINDVVLSDSNLSIPIQQQLDRWYSNP